MDTAEDVLVDDGEVVEVGEEVEDFGERAGGWLWRFGDAELLCAGGEAVDPDEAADGLVAFRVDGGDGEAVEETLEDAADGEAAV